MGCGEREELRTFTMELSTFQQVPFPVVQTMVDVLGLPVAKLQELDMNKDRSRESKCDLFVAMIYILCIIYIYTYFF